MVRIARFMGFGGFLLVSVFVSGCGPQVKVRTASVRGTITMNGQPRAGIVVEFTPDAMIRPSDGITDAAGRYVAQFTPEQKGVALGPCGVTFFLMQENGKILLPATADGNELRLDIGKEGLVFDHDIKYDGTLP
jgi:hypothetical protein